MPRRRRPSDGLPIVERTERPPEDTTTDEPTPRIRQVDENFQNPRIASEAGLPSPMTTPTGVVDEPPASSHRDGPNTPPGTSIDSIVGGGDQAVAVRPAYCRSIQSR